MEEPSGTGGRLLPDTCNCRRRVERMNKTDYYIARNATNVSAVEHDTSVSRPSFTDERKEGACECAHSNRDGFVRNRCRDNEASRFYVA